MAEEIQPRMMKSFPKRKGPNAHSEHFKMYGPSSCSSPASSLIQMFLEETDCNNHVRHRRVQSFRREPLLLQFLELVTKMISLDRNDKDNLKHVLEDMKTLGLSILEMEPHASVFTTIVTEAVEVPRKQYCNSMKDGGLIKVDPNPQKGIYQELIAWAVKKVVNYLYPDREPCMYLLDDFGPIREETHPTSDLIVIGEIPLDLNGMMVRNGPDPPHDPVNKYAWLDGDSMLHAIRFQEGKATYVSRYVQTSRYKQEKFLGEAEFLKYGDLQGRFGLFMALVQLLKAKLGILDISYGWLNANTGLVYHDRMLMALQDWDKPYVIDVLEDGDLITLGTYDYGKQSTYSFLPHPKKDPITGVSNKPPYVIYNHVTSKGSLRNSFPITTKSGPTYMHDFGITQNYIIFMDLPYCFNPENMVNHDDSVYSLDLKKESWFGFLPRYATSENQMVWFKFDDAFFIYHNGNSWEEDGDKIILISCVMEPKIPKDLSIALKEYKVTRELGDSFTSAISTRGLDDGVPTSQRVSFTPAHVFTGPSRKIFNPAHLYTGPSVRKRPPVVPSNEPNYQGINLPRDIGSSNRMFLRSNEMVLQSEDDKDYNKEENELSFPTLYKFTFNMKTKKASREQLSKTLCDYPKINERYIGRRSRYVYTSEFSLESLNTSIVKTDIQWKTELKLDLAEKSGSEVAFVPYYTSTAEDHGYLTTFVHDEYMSLSYAYVIDAQQMQLLAMIQLPNRVPYGFHAIFVTEEELQSQMKTLA